MEDCIDIKNDRDKEMQGLKMWRDLSYSSVADNYEILKQQHLDRSRVMTQD